MEPITAGILACIALSAFSLARSDRRDRYRALRDAAEGCGVIVDEEASVLGFFRSLSGRVGGREHLAVKISDSGHATHVVVTGLEAVRALRLSPEGMGTSLGKAISGSSDVETGDPAFDRTVLVKGFPPLALAVFDAETRGSVMAVFSNRILVKGMPALVSMKARADLADGRLVVRLLEQTADLTKVRGAMSAILAAVTQLDGPREVRCALATNARQDPLPQVRLKNLRTLVREYPKALAHETLALACDDPHDDVALAAALELGTDGHATLLRLTEQAEDDGPAAVAIRALGNAFPAERALALLAGTLPSGRTRRAVACMEALMAHADEHTLARAERPLIEALGSANVTVLVAAARALGRAGSIAAVLPLQEAAERHGGDLRMPVRQAVAEIHARLSGASPGQLSLTEGEAGQVSLAGDSSGRLSIPEKPARRDTTGLD